MRSLSAYERMLASMTHDGHVIFEETTIYGQRSHELKEAAAGLTDVVQAELLAKSTSFPHGYHAEVACASAASLITQGKKKKKKKKKKKTRRKRTVPNQGACGTSRKETFLGAQGVVDFRKPSC